MPTGHTEPVISGMISGAADFAYECASSFVWSRREGGKLTYPKIENMHEAKRLGEYVAELAEWDAMPEEGRYALWSEYYNDLLAKGARAKAETGKAFQRLMRVRAEVEDIEVPESHVAFKQFMLDQLDETIKYDGTHNPEYYTPLEYVEFCETNRTSLVRMIESYTKQVRERGASIAKGREWIRTLAELYNLKVEE